MKDYLGAVDNQTPEQKQKNYSFKEVVATASVVDWKEKPQSEWRSFPLRYQDGSGSCVCMTYATELGIIFQQKYGTWIDFSSSFPYQQRTSPQYEGCTSTDVYDKFPKIGNVYDSIMPSQNLSEQQIMSVPRLPYYDDIAKVYQVKRIELPLDFETVASTIQATGKGVMVWFRFAYNEWTDKPTILTDKPNLGHSVTAVDFTLVNGKKYLVIQDSWGSFYGLNGLRLISEEFFNARCFLASYLMTFKKLVVESTTTKPVFDGSIVSAQTCFEYEGFFPSNVSKVEFWGNITRTACIDFQKKYNLQPTLGNFGPLTKAKLYELYPAYSILDDLYTCLL